MVFSSRFDIYLNRIISKKLSLIIILCLNRIFLAKFSKKYDNLLNPILSSFALVSKNSKLFPIQKSFISSKETSRFILSNLFPITIASFFKFNFFVFSLYLSKYTFISRKESLELKSNTNIITLLNLI